MSSTFPDMPTELEMVRGALAAEYEVVSELGHGGMAVVYRAVERELGRDVALKVLPAQQARDADVVTRFLDEARTAARLEHPHVIPIYRVGRAGALPYIAMKLVAGPSLADLLVARGALPPAEVRRILIETAQALAYAHERGVVHRDVKPDNILLDPSGRVVVTDFGIAKVQRSQRLTATGVAVGTPRYMSPEQARARPLDGRSDLYALGIVAYECLTGRVPFDGDDPMAVLLAHVQEEPPHPTLTDPAARELWPVVERLLAKRPEDRFQTADELLAALGAPVPAGHHHPSSPVTRVPDSGDPTRVTPDAYRDLARPTRTGGLTASLRAFSTRARVVTGLVATAIIVGASLGVAWMVRPEAKTQCSTAGEAGVILPPLIAARPGERLDIFYDLCGYEKGTALATTVTMRRAGRAPARRGEAPLRARFGDFADGPAMRRERRLTVPTLTVGDYRLQVAVRDPRGRERTAATTVRIAW